MSSLCVEAWRVCVCEKTWQALGPASREALAMAIDNVISDSNLNVMESSSQRRAKARGSDQQLEVKIGRLVPMWCNIMIIL